MKECVDVHQSARLHIHHAICARIREQAVLNHGKRYAGDISLLHGVGDESVDGGLKSWSHRE